jgi:hypothetical protein
MSVTPARKSVLMMSNTGQNHNLTGDKIRADGYFGRTDGIHTVMVVVANFTGSFGIQGTLATVPVEADWFDINVNVNQNVSSASPRVSFPVNPASPTNVGGNGDDSVLAFTFVGNFVYLRAILDRSTITEPSPLAATTNLGVISKVLLSM